MLTKQLGTDGLRVLEQDSGIPELWAEDKGPIETGKQLA